MGFCVSKPFKNFLWICFASHPQVSRAQSIIALCTPTHWNRMNTDIDICEWNILFFDNSILIIKTISSVLVSQQFLGSKDILLIFTFGYTQRSIMLWKIQYSYINHANTTDTFSLFLVNYQRCLVLLHKCWDSCDKVMDTNKEYKSSVFCC